MEPNFDKKVYKAAVINTDEIVKSQARDVGDARMTESKEDRSGNWFSKIGKRIWKHNLAQEWYRQREISRVKKDIVESGNIYAGEKDFDPDNKDEGAASKEAFEAIIERFTSEYENEEVLRAGETRNVNENPKLNAEIKELIKNYAGSSMEPAAFDEEKKRILSAYDKNIASKKSLYADNLLSIANDVRDAFSNGADLKKLDFEVELTLGSARQSLGTEAHLNSFDNAVEYLQNSKVGKYIGNEGVAIAAGLYDVGRNLIQKTVRSKAAQWMTFGASTVIAGTISGIKERARVTRERAQHQRESAKGMQFKDKDMKRRQEMQKNSYETKRATIILENLDADLYKINEGEATPEEVTQIIGRLADLEARIKLNDQQKIDLISYDKFSTLEKDRTAMDLKRAELKVALRNSEHGEDFDTRLASSVETQKGQMMKGEHGIEAQDKVFKKLRNTRAWKAAAKTVLIGATIGTVWQEGKALFDPGQDSILEGVFGSKENLVKHGTALEGLRRYFSGDHTTVPNTNLHEEMFEGSDTHIQLPEGFKFGDQNSDGTFDLLRDGKVVAGHVPIEFDANGNLSQEAQEALAKNGITTDFGMIGEKTTEAIHESTQDYVNNHAEGMTRVHRELWYDNDTPHPFDKNELRTDWGGVGGKGIDENGNYVFNVGRMTDAGSFHGAETIDANGQVKGGALKMLFSFSKGTQHQVFEVPIGPDGNAVIDPNSSLGKLMFENHNGHAVFTGKFAEVAQSMGTAEDGGENVRILSTHVGGGKEFIDDVVDTDTTVPKIGFNIPDENTYDLPPFIPVTGRRPLERGEYRTDKEVAASRPTKKEEDKVESVSTEQVKEVSVEGVDAKKLEQMKDTDPMLKVLKDQEANMKKNLASAIKRGDEAREAEVLEQLEVNRKAQVEAVARLADLLNKPFRDDIAEHMRYSPDKGFVGQEEMVSKEADHVYGFAAGLDRKEIDAKLKDVKKFKNPEVFIFENDTAKRDANLKQIKELKKWYPNVAFTYVALIKGIKKIKEPKGIKEYTTKRLENILKKSKIDGKKVKNEIHLDTKKPIGEVSDNEFNIFMDKGTVSKARVNSIVTKMKAGEQLSDKEEAMRAEKNEEVEKLLKK